MHIRTMTRRTPAKATDIAYVLDVLAQILDIASQIQSLLDKS